MSKVRVRLILEKKGKVLLIRQTKDNGGSYTLVGGKIDPDETATQALIRESYEEAGIILRAENLTLVHTLFQNQKVGHKISLFFSASSWSGEISSRERHKFKKLEWFDLNHLPSSTKPKIARGLNQYKQGIPFSEIDLPILVKK